MGESGEADAAVDFTWVQKLRLIALDTHVSNGEADRGAVPEKKDDVDMSILSFNMLAESYLSRRSHPGLPQSHAEVAFDKTKRRRLLLNTFSHFADPSRAPEQYDIIGVQEMDLLDIIVPFMKGFGYDVVHESNKYDERKGDLPPSLTEASARSASEEVDFKRVTCAIFFASSKYTLLHSIIIEFDDLAGVASSPVMNRTASGHSKARKGRGGTATDPLSGMLQSFQRRNRAIVAVLKHKGSDRNICVCSAHLYWNPGYEYVKLSQAKYLMDHLDTIARKYAIGWEERVPVIICGDFNSKPRSVVHNFLTRGSVDGRTAAPWNCYTYPSLDEEEFDVFGGENNLPKDNPSQIADLRVGETELRSLSLSDSEAATEKKAQGYDNNVPQVRYLLDFTLNRFTRWLRILGIDAALETKAEEKVRTSGGQIALFDRCRAEQRTLLTTSKNILLRKDCPPGAYLIQQNKTSDLELVLVQLLLTHGVVLRPRNFLTRCVVCNGHIFDVADKARRSEILKEHGCPNLDPELTVYGCTGCGQGYWWCENPNSSASRVKSQTANLFQKCLRGGVKIDGPLHMFDFIDVELERKIGEDEGTLFGKGRPKQAMDTVIGWLKQKDLSHEFQLRSAYALVDDDPSQNSAVGEKLPFTNVTTDFVGTLDYILFETDHFSQTHYLYAPTSFRELNVQVQSNGHVLPSDIWPSDHLALGCKLRLNPKATAPHMAGNPKCACGCVPDIPGLFEMAAMRKKAREVKAIRPEPPHLV